VQGLLNLGGILAQNYPITKENLSKPTNDMAGMLHEMGDWKGENFS